MGGPTPSTAVETRATALVDSEKQLFDSEYRRFFVDGETKPKHVGEPYLLENAGATSGVLLVHGLMAAPEEVREWAEYLFARGYTVYAPRMAGHGTSAADLSRRSAREWIDSVDRGYAILKSRCDRIVAAGFSTGGAVVLHRVIENPQAFEAVISISAPLAFRKFSARFAGALSLWNQTLAAAGVKRFRKEFVPNDADNPQINYLRCPVRSIAQVQRLMREVYRGLASVSIPALVIHAKDDPKVDVRSGRDIHRRLGASTKRYCEIDFDQHGIVRGQVAARVFAEVGEFLQQCVPAASGVSR
ncbi:MAG: alpha/beta fold hydrolase [Deltaproteobacteria bacterium]|nr:alpha/beta fold hydrolase [Deltaproteobacteria bacterium]